MRIINCLERPLEINGLLHRPERGKFWKLPEALACAVSEDVTRLGRRSTGGRIRFRTDSRRLWARVALQTLSMDQNFPLLGSAGCDVLTGLGDCARYRGIVSPTRLGSLVNEAEMALSGRLEDVTIYLPRNELVEDVDIGLDAGAQLMPPTPFDDPRPILFYGSSITEGCSVSHPGNMYVSVVSRWLNADFVNFGFSGAARGEPRMAEAIAGMALRALVLDYDHNAPSQAHLAATHEPFFRRVRAAQPRLPIVIMTRPDFDSDPEESAARREIIRRTYLRALDAGDRNVWFVDGETLFGARGRFACTIDRCHPNDLGQMRMAETLCPVLARALEADGTPAALF